MNIINLYPNSIGGLIYKYFLKLNTKYFNAK